MIWTAILGLLNQNKQNGQQQEFAKQQAIDENKKEHIQNSLQAQNLDFSKFGNNASTSNPILDNVMKKYSAGRYSQ